MSFAFSTVRELSAGLHTKAFTPVDLLEDTLHRVKLVEPVLNSFAYLDEEGARLSAENATKRQLANERLSPIDGIPTSIKDLIAQKNIPQRFGSMSTPNVSAKEDAPSVERLRHAGAVLLGKSTTSEFGCKGVGDSPLTGITRNPWNPNLTPGGSSCGAAAMVAAGLVPYALGTDGGGSIRIPAALTGIFGIKPQFARVPVYPTSATPTLAHVGPLTRVASDAEIVLKVICGFDARDPFSFPSQEIFSSQVTNRPLRIAYSATMGYASPTQQVLEVCDTALSDISNLGHEVIEVSHVIEDPIDLWMSEFYAGVGTRLKKTVNTNPELLDPAVLQMLQTALNQDMQNYYSKVFDRYALRDQLSTFFSSFDLLITPTLPCTAFPVKHNAPPGSSNQNPVAWVSYTYPFNLTGQPAASIPIGFTSEKLPVGLQIVSPCYREEQIFSLAKQYQERFQTLSIRPPEHTNFK